MKSITINKLCKYCNSAFTITSSITRKLNKQFCCLKCAATSNGKSNKGKKRSVEFKKALSLSQMGENNHFFGKTHSNETKKIISEKNKFSIEDFNHYTFTELEKCIFDGIMLADGHIEPNGTTSRISYGSKFKETIEDVKNSFPNIIFGNFWKSKKSNCWHLKSHSYYEIQLERNRWYQNNIKIIPKDIRLTIPCLYWWFVGDGYRMNYALVLCTDAYSEEDILFLIEKLKEIGFTTARKMKSRNRIVISRNDIRIFLDLLKNNHKISPQYAYKFSNKWKIKKEKYE